MSITSLIGTLIRTKIMASLICKQLHLVSSPLIYLASSHKLSLVLPRQYWCLHRLLKSTTLSSCQIRVVSSSGTCWQ